MGTKDCNGSNCSNGVVSQVSAGFRHTCAIDASGKLHCFGRNEEGQCDVPDDLGVATQVQFLAALGIPRNPEEPLAFVSFQVQ